MLERTNAYGIDFLYPAGDDTIGPCLARHGEFARPELDLLLAYATAPEGLFIDVGANIGALALPFARARPGWRVVGLEAHRGLCNILAANALGNGLYNAEPFHAAAGPHMGLVNFPAPPLSQAGNFGTLSLARESSTREPTRMFRLDDLAPPGAAALIKIDVEGYEPEVLKGAAEMLAAQKTVWIAEAADQHPDAARATIAAFQAAGYRVFWLFAPFATPASVKARPEKPSLGDSNILALPPGVENLWDLALAESADAARPRELSAYPYLKRYGY